jgi:hypothetical protein
VYGSYGAQANGYAVPYGGNYAGSYGGYGSNYSGSYGAYGGNYGAYGSAYGGASPYAAVCAALAYGGTTQGYGAVATSPYAATCAYLGLTGGAPGAGFASLYAGYPGNYSGLGAYGLSSAYPYSGQMPYYGASGSPYTAAYATNPYGQGSYGSYPSYWPSSTP